MKLPAPLPFEGVAFEKWPSMRYRSGFDVFGLIETVREKLSQAESEQSDLPRLGGRITRGR